MSKSLSVSIALATYNGEQYVGEQLDSIARQTRLPDELIISDDASNDATTDIIRNFSQNVSFPVKLFINQNRLGSTRNFEKAIRACNSDIIFLCDQDDIWYLDKIKCIEECFVKDAEVGAIFTDADVVDQNLHPFGPRLWKKVRFSTREQEQVETHDAYTVLLKHFVVTGTTMAFRAKYCDLVLPIPEKWIHDAWIALLIGAASYLTALPIPLVAYRQHALNQLGAQRKRGHNKGKSFAEIFTPQIELYESAKDRLEEFADYIPNAKYKIICLNEKIAFLRMRGTLPVMRCRRLPSVLNGLINLRYHRFGRGIRAFVNDLFR